VRSLSLSVASCVLLLFSSPARDTYITFAAVPLGDRTELSEPFTFALETTTSGCP
jgi:hypothetical protein